MSEHGLTHQQMIALVLEEQQRVPLHPDDCTDEEIDKHLQHLGDAAKLQMRERDLVRKVMLMLATRIKRKTLADRHMDLLGRFLVDVINRREHALALLVLGRRDLIKRGAPSKDEEVRWAETVQTYLDLLELGASDEEALEYAWVTWTWDTSADRQVSVTEAINTPVKSTRSDGKPMSLYDHQIERLKIRLNKEGVREPAKRGRKPQNKK